MHVGIFGGTFNPIHLGHIRSAGEIRQTCALDHIYFVPAARPPHKDADELASSRHRLRMVELAVADEPAFSASAVELERAGPSYSVDTIRSLSGHAAGRRAVFYPGARRLPRHSDLERLSHHPLAVSPDCHLAPRHATPALPASR